MLFLDHRHNDQLIWRDLPMHYTLQQKHGVTKLLAQHNKKD